MTVKVKPLVWDDWAYGDGKAQSVFGVYHVWGRYWRAPGEASAGILADDPKAAAQADYEARILAAIEAPAQEPVAWKAVYTDILGGANKPLLVEDKCEAEMMQCISGWTITPLYTTPQPDETAALRAKLAEVEELIRGHEEAAADSRRLAREIDVALHGEDGAAKQASLCDLVHPVRELRAKLSEVERAAYERGVREAAEACDWGDFCGDNAVRSILALLTQEGR